MRFSSNEKTGGHEAPLALAQQISLKPDRLLESSRSGLRPVVGHHSLATGRNITVRPLTTGALIMSKPPSFDDIAQVSIPTPTGNFVPYRQVGDLVFLAGQTCSRDNVMIYCGQVGRDLSVADGHKAARICMENLLAALREAVQGDWSRVIECVKLNGYVNATEPFAQSPQVIDGASNLLVALMGEAGKHARTAVGVAALPGNAAVEVEAVFRVGPPGSANR